MTLPSAASLLKKYHVRPQKRLGQNFLIAPPTLEKIVSSLEIKPHDTVLEIGPGLGVMTAMLAKRCHKVIAIEKDSRLLDIARTEFGHVKNIEWIEGDFLVFDLNGVTGDLAGGGPPPARSEASTAGGGGQSRTRHHVIGNIPYEITSPILFRLLDHPNLLSTVVLLMQKEVAMRIVAKPRTKEYGILSVCCQALATCERLFDVSAKSFMPPPKVTSSVVRLNFVRSGPLMRANPVRIVVRAAFGKRRKTLRNALLGSTLNIDAPKLDEAFAATGIAGTRRPEELSVEEFIHLARWLDKA